MNHATRLSHEIDALRLLALASSARVEAMKATNAADVAEGSPPRYGKGSFVVEAQYLADITSAVCELIADVPSTRSDTPA